MTLLAVWALAAVAAGVAWMLASARGKAQARMELRALGCTCEWGVEGWHEAPCRFARDEADEAGA